MMFACPQYPSFIGLSQQETFWKRANIALPLIRDHSPTTRELEAPLGYQSNSSVHAFLTKLEIKGFIKRGAKRTARTYALTELGQAAVKHVVVVE